LAGDPERLAAEIESLMIAQPWHSAFGENPMRTKALRCGCLLGCLLVPAFSRAADDVELTAQVEAALRKASGFFRDQVSSQGGYLWRYSADLEKREGEGRADAATVWVQPPGTPAVGQAFLDVHQRTGDPYYLRLARDAGGCLVAGQLRSGGWDYRIDFDPARGARNAYRVEPERAGQRNTTTLDDDNTQSALRMLMRLDQRLEFKDAEIHEAVQFGLASLLKSQYPNGAWPQRYSAPPDPEKFPVLPASYPEAWPREWPSVNYADYYTLNDNTLSDVIDTMLLAERIYGNAAYRDAALRAGEFLLLAQMPDPQPGWAQQYDRDMHPAWARKFEPPGLTGSESAGVVRNLLRFYQETGQRKYLDAAKRGLDYYRQSRLPDGRMARFYELRTNRPLYFTRQYELTYDDSDVPTHYSFKSGDWTASLLRQYEALASAPAVPPRTATAYRPPAMSNSLAARARDLIRSLDERGAWVEAGRLKYHGDQDETRAVIDCQTFARNIRQLADYLAAADPSRIVP
jgi:PelA/Pel-15E family pectate lyase